jgi:hypothetical protein
LIFTPKNHEEDIKMLDSPFNETSREDFEDEDVDDEKEFEG